MKSTIDQITRPAIVALLMSFAINAAADGSSDSLDLTIRTAVSAITPERLDFETPVFVGLDTARGKTGLRIRGWQLNSSLYLGQARVADRWGPGLVYEKGDSSYGINHRGVEWRRQF